MLGSAPFSDCSATLGAIHFRMSAITSIQWADTTVNPIMGCELFPSASEVILAINLVVGEVGVKIDSKRIIKELGNEFFLKFENFHPKHKQIGNTTNIWHESSSQSSGNDRSVVAPYLIGSASVVSKVGWAPDDGRTVWIDGTGTSKTFKAGTSGFSPVPKEVWNFHIGGYQVCEKWLKDRGPKKGQTGRTLSAEDIAHYQNVVIALSETIRLMAEIDQVIETHGGWPGAFQTESATETK
jgi:hypothetical protein